MNAYKDYQAINLPWLKEIPSHWEIRRNKNIFSEMKAEVGERSSDYMLLSLTLNGIIPRNMESGGKFPADFSKYKIVKKGYMAFCLFDIDETPRTVGLSEYDGMLTGAYTIMQVSNINSRYILYYYLALDSGKQLKPIYKGLRKTISIDVFQSTKIPVPPRDEQDQIVRFLDWKVSEINRLINIMHREIERLEELEKAVVSCAFTNTKWKSVSLKKCLYSISDVDHFMPQSVECGFPYVMTGDLMQNASDIEFTKCKQIKQEDYYKLSMKSKPQKGDVIFARYATIGSVCYVDTNIDFLVSYSCVTLKPNNLILGKYLFYYLKSNSFIQNINQYIKINTQGNVGMESIRNVQILLPTIEEQDQIVAYLDKQMNKIHSAISNKQEQIEKLQELKTRLISDAVTGKIDVRGIKIPDYEYVEEETQSNTEYYDNEDPAEQEE